MLSSRTARRIGLFLAALPAAVALALAPGTAASASPVITYLGCESGASTYLCTLSYGGAPGAVTIHWSVNGVPRPAWDGSTYVRTGCTIGQSYSVSVSVVDVYGVATDSTSVLCRRIWQ